MNTMARTRRGFLKCLAAGPLSIAFAPDVSGDAPVTMPRPIVGAIRWDAWYDPSGPVTQAMRRDLTPERYHFRLPFFAHIAADGEVTIDGSRQEVMDREISCAVEAGLGYWAFVGYEPGSSLDRGLSLYLSSSLKDQISFCLISEMSRWGTRGHTSPMIERHQLMMMLPNYQCVLHNRPLYFIGFFDKKRLLQNWGGLDSFRIAVDQMRDWVRRNRGAEPYVVIMDWQSKRAAALARDLKADAISCYAHVPAIRGRAPFSSLATAAESYWNEEANTGFAVIPTIMTGWNDEPRPSRLADEIPVYIDTAEPAQIADETKKCLLWIAKHTAQCEANAALIYAWNENTEGGWLIPTYPFNRSRLDALRNVLNNRETGR
jgi:hypothetical protein